MKEASFAVEGSLRSLPRPRSARLNRSHYRDVQYSLLRFLGRALIEALRTGEPQSEAKQGGDVFANLYADAVRLEGSLRAMTAGTTPVADALAGAFPWENARTVVDVGCAQDGVPVRLALAHEHLI